MQVPQDAMPSLLALLRQQAPELLPACRFLILGPYLAGAMLSEHSRPPTVRELIALKRVVERHGPTLSGLLASLLEASGRLPAVRAEIQLDRLLELDPSLWSHPSQVQGRPFSDGSELLEACRLRLAEAPEEEQSRLEVVEEKLARAVAIEDKARERRRRREGRNRRRGTAPSGS